MKKQLLVKLQILLSSFLILSACSFNDSSSPEKTEDTVSKTPVIINSIFTDSDGDQAVSLNARTINNLVKDARTVMPERPNLYFSVIGSTGFSDEDSDSVWDDTEDADCSSTAAAGGNDVIAPCYATSADVMSGLTVTLKLGKTYYLTVYATESSPSSLYYGSHVSDTLYTSYTDGAKTYAGLDTSATDAETYAKYRELLISNLKDNAVLKGTLCVYVGTDSSGNIQLRKNSSTGDVISSISITSSSRGISGVGQPVFIVDLPATSSLSEKKRTITKIRVKWTAKTYGINGSFEYNLDGWQSTGETIEFKPYVSVGEYDLDINFLNSESNDVFTIHDTLIVWKNQKSYLLGSGSFCTSSKISADTARDGTSTDKANCLVAGSVQTLDQGTVTSGGAKGYSFTADDVDGYLRTVYYVSGHAGDDKVLPDASGTPNGSLLNPYATVQAALDAIALQRDAGYDDGKIDWNVVLDGYEVSPADISFTNDADTDLNLTIRNFSTRRAILKNNVTVINKSSTAQFNLYLTNVDWNAAYTSYRMYLGTDVFLSNTSLCSDVTSDSPSAYNASAVVLYVAKDGTTQDGTFFIDAENDVTSTVMNIEVKDENDTDSKGYGHNVLSYRYHAVNSSSIASTTFINKNPLERFGLSTNYYYYNVDNTSTTENMLDVDAEVGSDSYGCEIVKVLNKYGLLSFNGSVYSGKVSVSPYSFNVSDGVLSSDGTMNVTVNVSSTDTDTYPVNGLLSYLKTESNGGTLGVKIKENNGLAKDSDKYITLTEPDSATVKSDGTADYAFTVQLNSAVTGLSSGQHIFYLYISFTVGSDSASSSFDGIFRVLVNI